ncbi:hypothetical protein AZE42_11810, partial [Rhizopogon vesiculosus]
KLIIRCRVLGGGDEDDDGLGTIEEDISLRQLENTMLNSVSLRGVKEPSCSRTTRTLTTQASGDSILA